MLDMQHNIVNALYSIKGMVESHTMQVREGRFENCEAVLRHAEDVLQRTYSQADKALLMARTLGCILRASEKQKCAGRAASIRYAWRQVRRAIQEELTLAGIEVIEHIPEDFPVISCQRTELRNILLCLARNAAQEMGRDGKLIIRAELSFNMEENQVAVITLADTGQGMTAERLGQLFQPFFTTKPEGNGLGLFITRALIKKNRGRISVSSFRGRGTAFKIEFPLYRRRYAEASAG